MFIHRLVGLIQHLMQQTPIQKRRRAHQLMHQIFLIELIQRRKQLAIIPASALVLITEDHHAKQHRDQRDRTQDDRMDAKQRQKEQRDPKGCRIQQDADDVIP